MLVLLSPAKIQNFKPENITDLHSQPEFINETKQLIHLIKKLIEK